MPMCPKESGSGIGQTGIGFTRRNVQGLKLELSYNSYVMGHVMGLNENRSPTSEFGDGVDDKTEPDGLTSGEEMYSAFNYTDEDDDDAQSVFRCSFCDFEINASVLRRCLEELHSYNPKNMVCPVCDEKLGEDPIGQHSSSRKRTWRSEKSRIWAGNSAMYGQKFAAWESPMRDSLLSSFIRNLSHEDSINNASNISNAKSLWTDAPEDREKGKLRASFFQELVFSTML